MKRTMTSVIAVSLLWLLPAAAVEDPESQAPAKKQRAPGTTPPPPQQPAAQGQSSPSTLIGVLQWLQSKANTSAASNTSSAAADAGKSMPKQTQSISIDHGSTTLIDQSSASDLLSTALNLTPVSSGTAAGGSSSATGTPGSGTVTVSAYAIRALFNPKQDPLAPAVYNNHAGWRRVFFTVGREQSSSNSSSGTNSSSTNSPGTSTSALAVSPRAATPTSTSSSTSAHPGTIVGAQVLLLQKRDASNIVNNQMAMSKFQEISFSAAAINAKYTTELILAICGNPVNSACETRVTAVDNNAVQAVQTEVDHLSATAKAQVIQLVKEYNDEVRTADVSNRLDQAIQYLQHQPQISLNFQTTQRTAGLPDEYFAELIYDRGIGQQWFFTFNGSYDYSNSSMIGGDLRTERGALQFSRALANSGTPTKSALQLNLSGEGVHQDTGWHYRAQLQLVVPVSSGINIPLSFGYGNETDVLRQQEKGVYAKFGLTVDFGKLIDALRPQEH